MCLQAVTGEFLEMENFHTGSKSEKWNGCEKDGEGFG